MPRPLLLPNPLDFDWEVPTKHYSDNPDEAVFFYGGPFSNFVGRPILIHSAQPYGNEYLEYKTVEHFYQACKARTRRDHLHIVWTPTPGEAKALGQQIKIRQHWDDWKLHYMLRGLRHKFDYEPYKRELLSTGQRYIAEDSPTDAEWGIRNRRGGYTGNNYLGRLLIMVRSELVHQATWGYINPDDRI